MNIIVAMCKHTRGIGYKNKLPLLINEDMKRFKKLTTGNKNNVIIMGTNTWYSLPYKPLPNRHNHIITKSHTFIPKCSVTNFITTGVIHNYEEVWIIGGENIYKQYLTSPYVHLIKNIYVTEIDNIHHYDFDTFFPNIPECFKIAEESPSYVHTITQGDKQQNVSYKFLKYTNNILWKSFT